MAKKTKTIPNTDSGEKTNTMNLFEVMDEVIKCKDDMISIRKDMIKMADVIGKLESAVRILANRLNRVDGMGK